MSRLTDSAARHGTFVPEQIVATTRVRLTETFTVPAKESICIRIILFKLAINPSKSNQSPIKYVSLKIDNVRWFEIRKLRHRADVDSR